MTRDGERRPFDPAIDMPELLLEAARIADLCLVIVDPVILAVRGDSNTNGDVRRGLFPLVKLAETTGAAVIGITHFSKGTSGKNPIERVTGSLAFAAAARVVLAVARIPEDQGGGRVVLRAKNNLGPDEGGFRFDIRPVDVAGAEAVRIAWGEPIAGSAHDILNEAERHDDPDERGKADELAQFLRDCLTESGGSMDRRAILNIAKQSGYSERACDRARDRVGVTTRTQGFGKDRRSIWTLAQAHNRQSLPAKSNVLYGAKGGNGANDETQSPPIPPLKTNEKCTREVGANDDEASDYLRASRGE